MKTVPIVSFLAGAAAASAVFLLRPALESPDSEKSPSNKVLQASLTQENAKLTERVKALEKQVAAESKAEAGGADEDGEQRVVHKFDESKMEEMMKQQAEREANRESDKLALRLKLTAEQKESLRKFLLTQKENERAYFRDMVKNGGKAQEKPAGQSRDEFLKGLLTPEQQAEYAKSQEEQRVARAEEYAHRKVRRLNDQLSLTEEQREQLFQSYAQKKLADTDPTQTPAGAPGDVVGAATGGVVAFSSVGGAAGDQVEFDLDIADMVSPGSSDLDRSTMEKILTPEQLAVYDQRKAEVKDQGNGLFIQELALPPLEGGEMRVEVIKEQPAPPAGNP